MPHRIEISYKKDSRLLTRTEKIRSLGFMVTSVELVEVYTISRDFSNQELNQIYLWVYYL